MTPGSENDREEEIPARPCREYLGLAIGDKPCLKVLHYISLLQLPLCITPADETLLKGEIVSNFSLQLHILSLTWLSLLPMTARSFAQSNQHQPNIRIPKCFMMESFELYNIIKRLI